MFSQFGEVIDINLVRDKATGKSKGFCFIGFEDQRSTVLSVDNFNGYSILNRIVRVDHVLSYKGPKKGEKEDEEEFLQREKERRNAILPVHLNPDAKKSDSDQEEVNYDDPMHAYLADEKRKKSKKEKKSKKAKKEKSKSHRKYSDDLETVKSHSDDEHEEKRKSQRYNITKRNCRDKLSDNYDKKDNDADYYKRDSKKDDYQKSRYGSDSYDRRRDRDDVHDRRRDRN
ncbi:hypothetical protein BC833DRAFT_589114 [Globomyces pollinis-pini]|nr:hypothetical protein BC833DRAFT_589114 [Globomyces pollinis-pini]